MSVDRDWENERHRRRMALMRMQGELNRAERRHSHLLWITFSLCMLAAVIGAVF